MSFNILVITKISPNIFQELHLHYQIFFADEYTQALTYLKNHKIEVILLETEMLDQKFKSLVESNNVLLFSANNPLLCLKFLEQTNLVGISNKTRFYRQVDSLFKQAHQDNFSLCVMIIDIDDFKQINDRLGHLAGDEMLEKLEQEINKNIRNTDLLVRFGGDEFIIALPRTEISQAKIIAKRLLNKFEVSIGISCLREDDLEFKTLINRADQALYRAKALGKNQVEISEQ